MDESAPSGTVQAGWTLLRVLEALFEAGESGVTDLAAETGLTKGTVHKHLTTLAEAGYVVNDEGTYRLGFRFLTLGGAVRDRNRLCSAATPEVLALSETTDELCTLAVEENGHGVFVFGVNDDYGIRRRHHLGSRFHLHSNAAGKAMLARLPDGRVRHILETTGMPAVTERTTTDPATLLTELATVREQGYALNVREIYPDINGIGVAVHDEVSDTLGALTVVGPASRLSPERLESEYAELLADRADDLELRLRYDD
jgi:DNA-binding IclR family transcriptional regulator